MVAYFSVKSFTYVMCWGVLRTMSLHQLTRRTSLRKRETTEILISELYDIRLAIRTYDDLHKQLCTISKARVREISNRLPKTIHVPLFMPSIPVRNTFAVLVEEDLQIRCERCDFLSDLSAISMGQVTQSPGAPTSLLQPST